MRINGKKIILLIPMLTAGLFLFSCSAASPSGSTDGKEASAGTDGSSQDLIIQGTDPVKADDPAHNAVNFEHELDSYKPQKDSYNFYFTYKTVHPWWDAVALGMEEAQRQYLDRGITITYEYMAPDQASAEDQTKRLLEAEKKDYDVIGVDVADTEIISPVIDRMMYERKKELKALGTPSGR